MNFPIYFYILIQLLFVSWGDIKTDKIPNLWSLLNIFTYIFLILLFPTLYPFSIETFLFPIIFLVIGFVLFLLKIMGGGDSKYLASFFLIIPEPLHDKIFENLLLSTILIGTFVFLTNFVKNLDQILHNLKIKNYLEVKRFFGTKFSYAPVILLAWIWMGWKIKVFQY